jgi:DNA-binding transcriptional MerR regulator/methylmalonyl-CoA mutase cobalamin-binding subunit
MSDEAAREPRHPIRVVTSRTGLSAHAVRAWELRYEAVTPQRSEGGHRLYSDEDIHRLRLLCSLTEGGRRIGQIAGLETAELADLLQEDRTEGTVEIGAARRRRPDNRSLAIVEEAYESILRYDDQALDSIFRRAALDLSAPALIDDVVVPLLERVGVGWTRGQLRPAQEHMATAVVQRTLGWILDTFAPSRNAPKLVVATPSGQQHSLGAQLAAASAATVGWDVMYLGPDLPAEDVAVATAATGARAVALSLVFPADDVAIHSYLKELAASLSVSVALIVGGPALASYDKTLDEIGAVRLSSYEGLRSVLLDLADGAA